MWLEPLKPQELPPSTRCGPAGLTVHFRQATCPVTAATALGLDLTHSRVLSQTRAHVCSHGASHGATGLGAISAVLESDSE